MRDRSLMPDTPPASFAPSPVAAPDAAPWLAIWIRPRRTLRAILDSSPRRHVHLLAMAASIAGFVVGASRSPFGMQLGVAPVVVASIVLGALRGLAWLYLGGWLMGVTGRWLEGQGDALMVRAAIAWSSIPQIAGLLLLPPLVALLGDRAFRYEARTAPLEGAAAAMLGLLILIEVTLDLWSLVVLVKCLGEAHRFSAWRGLGALLLAALLIGVPLFLLVAAAGGLVLISGLTGSL